MAPVADVLPAVPLPDCAPALARVSPNAAARLVSRWSVAQVTQASRAVHGVAVLSALATEQAAHRHAAALDHLLALLPVAQELIRVRADGEAWWPLDLRRPTIDARGGPRDPSPSLGLTADGLSIEAEAASGRSARSGARQAWGLLALLSPVLCWLALVSFGLLAHTLLTACSVLISGPLAVMGVAALTRSPLGPYDVVPVRRPFALADVRHHASRLPAETIETAAAALAARVEQAVERLREAATAPVIARPPVPDPGLIAALAAARDTAVARVPGGHGHQFDGRGICRQCGRSREAITAYGWGATCAPRPPHPRAVPDPEVWLEVSAHDYEASDPRRGICRRCGRSQGAILAFRWSCRTSAAAPQEPGPSPADAPACADPAETAQRPVLA